MYQVIEKQQEPSGQWRIRAVVSNEESMFLWFGLEPEQHHIDTAIENQLRQRILAAPVIVEEPTVSATASQIRKALNAKGLRNTIEVAVAKASKDTQDDWEYSPIIHRYHPLIVSFWEGLGRTSQELDDLFALAKTL